MKRKVNEQNTNELEPLVIILSALLKEMSPNKKISTDVRDKIVKSLGSVGYPQLKIADILGMSATDVNKVLKKKKKT